MAFLIDTAILLCLHTSCFLFTGMTFFNTAGPSFLNHVVGLIVFLLLYLVTPPLLAMAYFIVFHAISGQTIGKICLGLKVVTQDGGRLTLSASFLRWTGYIVSSLPLAAGFFWAAIDSKGLAWHDRIASSTVINWPETT